MFGGLLPVCARLGVEGADKASNFCGIPFEQSLSVDNLFVFILLFEYFQVPPVRQTRVLNYGIYGAS